MVKLAMDPLFPSVSLRPRAARARSSGPLQRSPREACPHRRGPKLEIVRGCGRPCGPPMSGRVLRVYPNVLLRQIRCPDPLLAATETEVDGDRVLAPAHDLTDPIEAGSGAPHAP